MHVCSVAPAQRAVHVLHRGVSQVVRAAGGGMQDPIDTTAGSQHCRQAHLQLCCGTGQCTHYTCTAVLWGGGGEGGSVHMTIHVQLCSEGHCALLMFSGTGQCT